jgi:hypothetical protein
MLTQSVSQNMRTEDNVWAKEILQGNGKNYCYVMRTYTICTLQLGLLRLGSVAFSDSE